MPQDTAPKAGQGSPHRLPSGALGPTRSKPHLRPPSHPPRPEQPRVCLSRRPHEAEASWDGEHRRTSLREGEGTQEQEGSDRPGPFPPPPPRQHGGAAGPSPCPQRLPPPSPGEPPARRHPQRGRPAPLSRSPPPPPPLGGLTHGGAGLRNGRRRLQRGAEQGQAEGQAGGEYPPASAPCRAVPGEPCPQTVPHGTARGGEGTSPGRLRRAPDLRLPEAAAAAAAPRPQAAGAAEGGRRPPQPGRVPVGGSGVSRHH